MVAVVPPPPSAHRSSPTAAGVVIGLVTLALMVSALAVRGGAAFGLVVLAAIFVPLEKIFALHPRRVLRTGWRTDVVHFLVNNILATIGIIAGVVLVGRGLRSAVPEGVRSTIAGWPALAQFLVAIGLTEVCGYWAHRATHKVPFLWRFHKVHHSIAEMDWLAAARLHPLDQAFTRSCVILPLFALGFSRATFGAYLVVATLQAIFVHANVRFRFGPLRYVIGTPEYHHWHHANVPAAYNSNFAGYPIVDKMFGTLYLPDAWPSRYGIDEPAPSGYVRQLAWPFRRRELAESGFGQ